MASLTPKQESTLEVVEGTIRLEEAVDKLEISADAARDRLMVLVEKGFLDYNKPEKTWTRKENKQVPVTELPKESEAEVFSDEHKPWVKQHKDLYFMKCPCGMEAYITLREDDANLMMKIHSESPRLKKGPLYEKMVSIRGEQQLHYTPNN